VYSALDLDFDPGATGAVTDEAPGGASMDDVIDALVAEYGERFSLSRASLDPDTLALAERLAPEHRPR
jgi:hypothetical protein